MKKSIPLQQRTRLKGHTQALTAACFSSDATLALTASSDSTARVWNSMTGELMQTMHHASSVTAAIFSPGNALIATGTDDGLVQTWTTYNGDLVRKYNRHNQAIVSLSYSSRGDYLLSTDRKQAHIWNAKKIVGRSTNDLMYTYEAEYGLIKHAQFTPNGKYVVLITDTGHIQTYKIDAHNDENWKHVYTTSINPKKVNVLCASVSYCGKLLAIGLDNLSVVVWDIEKNNAVCELTAFTDVAQSIRSVGFDHRTNHVVTTCYHSIGIWNTKTGDIARVIVDHNDEVMNALYSPHDSLVLSVSKMPNAKIWDAISAEQYHTLSGHSDIIVNAQWSYDNKYILTASRDTTAIIWALPS